MSGLLPCPFCGRTTLGTTDVGDDAKTKAVACCDCGASGPWALSEFAAEQVWNKSLQARRDAFVPVGEMSQQMRSEPFPSGRCSDDPPATPPAHEPTTVVRLTAADVRSLLVQLEENMARQVDHRNAIEDHDVPTFGVEYSLDNAHELHRSIYRQTAEFMSRNAPEPVFSRTLEVALP